MTSHASRRTAHAGRFSSFWLIKLIIAEQVARLKQWGLVFDVRWWKRGNLYLFNISYYRLRAYTYPFQENGENSEYCFTRKDIHFKDIIDLYCFDRRLRSLIFNAIEKIEVAVRTKQVYAESTSDSHWFNDESLYHFGYNDQIKHIEADVNSSNEDFIKYYSFKYDNPPMPSSWMALEVVSFVTLSRLFQSLKFFLALRIFLILLAPEATLKRILKNCSNPIAACLILKIWDSPQYWQSLSAWREK